MMNREVEDIRAEVTIIQNWEESSDETELDKESVPRSHEEESGTAERV
jgi:hypothetical protein